MSSTFATIAWKELIQKLDAFAEAWKSDTPPDLETYLPELGNSQWLPTLVELIKIDLKHRWGDARNGRILEEYVRQFPELAADGHLPLDLIYEEFHVRRQSGEDVKPEDYAARFPGQAEGLTTLLRLESPESTTSALHQTVRRRFDAGETLDDFHLLMLLGEGSFAQVFLARQISMQRLVALKISSDKGEEHKTLAQLDHPNIVRVYSQTVLEGQKLRLLYMQYHAGGTLREVVDAFRRRPGDVWSGRDFLSVLDAALEVRGAGIPLDSINRRELDSFDWFQVVCWQGARIAEALGYSHGQGVLHRDLKPANILLSSDGSPKIADFNISFCKQVEGANPVTYFGGSLAYMSPEQLAACDPSRPDSPEDLDGRSDVFALGIVLWELLSGIRPYPDVGWGLQGSQLLGRMIENRQNGPCFDRLPAAVPPLLVRILRRCLQADPADRFQSAGELARQLRLAADKDVHEIFAPPATKLQRFGHRYPTWAILLLTALPNVLMSVLNIAYNWDEIVNPPEDAFAATQTGARATSAQPQREQFKAEVQMFNVLAYGSGFLLIALIATPIRRAYTPSVERPPPSRQTPLVRRRILQLAYWTAGISLAEWAMCGILFPLGLSFITGKAVLNDYVHFFVSHAINGTLAAVGTFFLVGQFSLNELLPESLDPDRPDAATGRQLERLESSVQFCLAATICLPLIAVALAVFLTKGRSALAVLAGLGLVGVWLANKYAIRLRHEIAVLKRVVA